MSDIKCYDIQHEYDGGEDQYKDVEMALKSKVRKGEDFTCYLDVEQEGKIYSRKELIKAFEDDDIR